MQDSPVFNYINSLSPIRPVKSNPIPHPFSSLHFTSPPSVFTSPHLNSSHKESRFFKSHISSSNPVESTCIQEVSAVQDDKDDVSLVEEASIPQISKYNCAGTTPDDPVGSPTCGGDTTDDLSLVPSPPPPPPREENASTELQNMYDNVQEKNQTPDWESLISDASELLIFNSPNDSEAFRCLMMQRASTSQPRFSSDVEMTTMQPESSNAIPYEAVSILHRGMRRRCLDFEMPGKQTSSEQNTMAFESSSRCAVPSIGLHLNAIAMSIKDRQTNVTHDDYSGPGKIQVCLQGSSSTMQESLDQMENETREDADQDVPVGPALEELNLSSPKKKRQVCCPEK